MRSDPWEDLVEVPAHVGVEALLVGTSLWWRRALARLVDGRLIHEVAPDAHVRWVVDLLGDPVPVVLGRLPAQVRGVRLHRP